MFKKSHTHFRLEFTLDTIHFTLGIFVIELCARWPEKFEFSGIFPLFATTFTIELSRTAAGSAAQYSRSQVGAQRGPADVGWGRAVAAAERAAKIRKVGKARFGGNVSDLASAQPRIAQQHGGVIQTTLQHMMREAAPGLFEKEMHVARRQGERLRDRDGAQLTGRRCDFRFRARPLNARAARAPRCSASSRASPLAPSIRQARS